MPPAVRLPNWTYEETLLAYDLYLTDYAATPVRYPDRSHQAVQRLSATLRALPLHPQEVRDDDRFRNPDGVARKVQNLMYLATDGAAGSENGSAMDAQVVGESQDAGLVHRLALAVRQGQPLAEARVGVQDEVSLDAYKAAALAIDSDLEQEVLARRRTEQSYLRRYLLQGQQEGGCCFCGHVLPQQLLVAAQIQRRADLTVEERLQFERIAVLACTLGCDALFEQGYIAVASNGRIIATETETTPALRARLDELEGRTCQQHNEQRSGHFQTHLAQRLIRQDAP